MYKILFVCTGNICRSPTAEAIFHTIIKDAGLLDKIFCDSAGIYDYHEGEAPDSRTIATAYNKNIDMRSLVARKVTEQDFLDFDLILAMDMGHLLFLERLQPEGSKAQIALYLSYVGIHHPQEVMDPYYESQEVFEQVFDLCSKASIALLSKLKDMIP